jgi:hemoglobin-like flavoprotein
MSLPSAPPESAPINIELLRAHLQDIVDREAELTALVYARFFALCPAAEELFGRYSESNKQRMMAETLIAVLNLLDRESWLDSYLRDMGSRHQFSYETPAHMYAPFSKAVVETLAELSGPGWSTPLARSWTLALDEVSEIMKRGYR